MASSMITVFAIGPALLVGLLLAAEIGFRIGRRSTVRGAAGAGVQVGAVQGALLGLLGLLLGFSFAAAGTRFLERQDLIVTEANAIGTAFLRAELLPAQQATELQSALRDYVAHRLETSRRLAAGLQAEDLDAVARMHRRIWEAAETGTAVRPEAILAVLDPVNEVIDLHTTRIFAGRKHLPALIMVLLVFCSLLSFAVIGYGAGLGDSRRTVLTIALSVVVATALWITIDLDYPRIGLLQLNDAPLAQLDLTPRTE